MKSYFNLMELAQRRIQNTVENPRWSFLTKTVISHNSNYKSLTFFLQKAPLQIFDWVLNRSLKQQTQRSFFFFFLLKQLMSHCVKSVEIRIFFWPVFSCIRTECRKTRTRKNSAFGHFSRNVKKPIMDTNIKWEKVFKNELSKIF